MTIDDSSESVRKLKEISDALGRKVFDVVNEARLRIEARGIPGELIATVISDALISVMGSFFACEAMSGHPEAIDTEKMQNEIAQDFMDKLTELVKVEHLRHGASILTINLKPKEEENNEL